MKWLLVISAVLVAGAVRAEEDSCYANAVTGCSGALGDDLPNCNALFSGFNQNVKYLKSFANEQLIRSYDYLLLAANFGTQIKNRPGFEKQFRSLSDKAWAAHLSLVHQISVRGGAHDYSEHVQIGKSSHLEKKNKTFELDELSALAVALDYEKTMAENAHLLHLQYSHANHPSKYDPQVAYYIEGRFVRGQAEMVRRLSGLTNDLKKLVSGSDDSSLAVHWFDNELVKSL